MLHEIDLSRADLNLLVLFEAVLDEGHVGRAAQRLNLSPSAVSHGLSRLRQQLNDPLFLKTPRGVVPTERAKALAEPIADILARVRQVVASAEPFDPATSRRRFLIGSPDGSSIVSLPALLRHLAQHAPGIDIGSRQIMADVALGRPWDNVFRQLDERRVDVAIVTFGEVPSRFVSRPLYDNGFVVVTRRDHPFALDPTLDTYCAGRHLVVSTSGDTSTFTGDLLASLGRTRRVQATVPHFILAIAAVAESDLIATIPESVAREYAPRFDLALTPVPFDAGEPSHIRLVAPRAALMDEGIVWLMDLIERLSAAERG
jgi:DNA-binding transcriptional LysR family regulator